MLRPASIEPIVSSWPPLCSIACAMENAIDVSHSPLRNAGHGRFTLSGDLDIEHAARLKEFLANEANGRVTLDLKDVTLVGPIAVRFLAGAETAGVRIVNCPDRRGESFPAANDAAARRAGAAKMSLPWNTQNDLARSFAQGGRASQPAARRRPRPRAPGQAGALERQRAELHRAPRALRLGGGGDRRARRRPRRARRRARRHFGSVRTAANTSRLPEYPLDISSGRQHVAALSAALARFGASARAGIDAATALGDVGTISTT